MKLILHNNDITTIADESLGTNLYFWRFWAHARRDFNFTFQTSPPPPINVENCCLQFLMIFNIVLGGGIATRFLKESIASFELQ